MECSTSQQGAINWTLEQVRKGAPLCSIQGLAGTGKTTILPHLAQALKEEGFTPVFATPTHRAAMILKSKGLEDVDTIHGRALRPRFSDEYYACLYWVSLGTPSVERVEEAYGIYDDKEPPALLVKHFEHFRAQHHYKALDDLREEVSHHPPEEVLSSIGIHASNHIVGFRPRDLQHQGVLIVDEASMLGKELLDLAHQVFPQIVLVGDPGQLPPVDDEPVLWSTPAYTLREIHRQAIGSPILALAGFSRQGHAIWRKNLGLFAPQVEKVPSAPAHDFLEGPLIVWKNQVREECTRKIRAGLGYPAAELLVGEPLVCRASSQAMRNRGFFNNALFQVEEVKGREVTLREQLSKELYSTTAHLEEIDGECCPTGSIPFRFAYALTCHTAQGGEWERVYVSVPQLDAYTAYARRGGGDEARRWAYTAMTRAKGKIRLLTAHIFT